MLNPFTLFDKGEITLEDAKNRLEGGLTLVLEAGTLLSTFGIKSGFLDFGLGTLFADALRPLLTRLVVAPIDDALEDYVRFNTLSPTAFLRPSVVETVSDFEIIRESVDSGFKSESIVTIIKMKRAIAIERNWKEYNSILREQFDVSKTFYLTDLDTIDMQLSELEKKFETALKAVISISTDVDISLAEDNIALLTEEIKDMRKLRTTLAKPKAPVTEDTKELSKSDILKAMLKELIDVKDAVALLIKLGYTKEDAELIVVSAFPKEKEQEQA